MYSQARFWQNFVILTYDTQSSLISFVFPSWIINEFEYYLNELSISSKVLIHVAHESYIKRVWYHTKPTGIGYVRYLSKKGFVSMEAETILYNFLNILPCMSHLASWCINLEPRKT